MIPRVGNSGSDIPIETQMLLLEAKEESALDGSNGSGSYILFLPVLDGEFRSSLQGNSANELELCLESGKRVICLSLGCASKLFSFSHCYDEAYQ